MCVLVALAFHTYLKYEEDKTGKKDISLLAGRLGLGTQDSHNTPQPVSFPETLRPCSVHCGVDCSMVLTLDNKLLCCGNNR